jgi:hypothetical protein
MNIYYGDVITPTIINTKTYGALSSGTTKDIFESSEFLNDSWAFVLKNDSSVNKIETPGTYKISLEVTDAARKKANYNVSLLNINLNSYSTNENYKQNVFFTNPINAYYYNYGGVPFKTENRGINRTTEIVNTYNNWAKSQEGYVLNIEITNNAVSKALFRIQDHYRFSQMLQTIIV